MADPLHGGFGHSPKFPNPSNLLFLLRAYDLSGITKYMGLCTIYSGQNGSLEEFMTILEGDLRDTLLIKNG